MSHELAHCRAEQLVVARVEGFHEHEITANLEKGASRERRPRRSGEVGRADVEEREEQKKAVNDLPQQKMKRLVLERA